MTGEATLSVTVDGRTMDASIVLNDDLELTAKMMQQLVLAGMIMVRQKCRPGSGEDRWMQGAMQ